MEENIEASLMEFSEPELANFVSRVEERAVLSSEETVEWLDWCQRRSNVKVTPWPVPGGILPPGQSGTLYDVRGGGEQSSKDQDSQIG